MDKRVKAKVPGDEQEWTLLGSAEGDSGEIEVWARPGGTVILEQPEHDECSNILQPAERDKLRELLDRAAMTGQAGGIMTSRMYRLTRDLKAGSPGNSFSRDLNAGDLLYRCTAPYAASLNGDDGVMVTEDPDGGYPGFEVPLSAVEEVPGG